MDEKIDFTKENIGLSTFQKYCLLFALVNFDNPIYILMIKYKEMFSKLNLALLYFTKRKSAV